MALSTSGVSSSTVAAGAAVQQAEKDEAYMTAINATFQGQTQNNEVTNNAVASATQAAAQVGKGPT